MTDFWKDGFWRISKYGVKHWVSGHSVSRDDWSRSGYGSSNSDYWWGVLAEVGAGSAAARFINPNAKCPVCGARVFFYQNEQGSRVFFDDLGPPWPKHPCTISAPDRTRTSSTPEQISPTPRIFSEVAQVEIWSSLAGLDARSSFHSKYGSHPWDAWRFERRFKVAGGFVGILKSIGTDVDRRLLLSMPRIPRSLRPGSIVFYRRGRLAFLDSHAMSPSEITVKRIRSSSGFIEALIVTDVSSDGSP